MLACNTPQIGEKKAPCMGCAIPVAYKTNARVRCVPCRAAARLASARKAMAKVRIKRGIAPVKGTTKRCARCGADFVRAGRRAAY